MVARKQNSRDIIIIRKMHRVPVVKRKETEKNPLKVKNLKYATTFFPHTRNVSIEVGMKYYQLIFQMNTLYLQWIYMDIYEKLTNNETITLFFPVSATRSNVQASLS